MTEAETLIIQELEQIAGGGTGGGGGASAANQQIQITAEQAIQAALPTSRGQKTAALSTSVVLSSDGPFATNFGLQADTAATSDTGSFSFLSFVKRLLQGITSIISNTGRQAAANLATGQVATSTTAATWVVARATRRGVMLKNLDASIKVYYGPATVTSANGMELKGGESTVVNWVGLIQVIAASGTPTVAYSDEYD